MAIDMPNEPGGAAVPVLTPKGGLDQTVAIGAASAASVALAKDTEVVRLNATSDCHIRFGSAATTANFLLNASQAEYLAVPLPRAGTTINVIQNSAAGILYISEMT